jgi:hypothetical protein
MARDEPSFIVAPGEFGELGAQFLDGFARPSPSRKGGPMFSSPILADSNSLSMVISPILDFSRAISVREPEGNGVAERFIRTLKENLLWVRDTLQRASVTSASTSAAGQDDVVHAGSGRQMVFGKETAADDADPERRRDQAIRLATISGFRRILAVRPALRVR